MVFLTILSTSFALLGTAVAYLIGLIVYRCTLHPLAGYKGPFLASISHWDQVYHAWKGDRHLEFQRCHEKYGPVYRYGPNNLSFNTSTALQTIYGQKANVQKSDFYSVFPAQKDAFSTHSAINKAAHARKRRVISHAFSDSAVKTMEKHILAHIRTFCNQIGGKNRGWTEGKNIADWCDCLTFDILGDLCFGKTFGLLERPDNRFAVELIGNAAQRHLICGCYPIIHELHLDKILFPKISAGRERYMQYSRTQAAERMKLGGDADRNDFFTYLIEAKDSATGEGFSMSELWGESNLLLIAGSDTTSTALAAVFFYLVVSQEISQERNWPLDDVKKIRMELELKFGLLSDIKDIEFIRPCAVLNSCVHLKACVDEAMRMSPPVPGLLPREVLAGGLVIDGHQIPAGTVVGVSSYAIHHNKEYFEDPWTYIPQRWYGKNDTVAGDLNLGHEIFSAEEVEKAKSAFCPFSIGPRGCIGKGLAYTELLTTVARMVCLYDMKRAAKPTEEYEYWKLGGGHIFNQEDGRKKAHEYQLWDTFTSKKNGPYLEFSSRGDAARVRVRR